MSFRVLAIVGLGVVLATSARADDQAERKAITYLSREVARWQTENHCFSCHNNGDAYRALAQAKADGFVVPDTILDESTRWLARPEGWQANGSPGPESDKNLARIQFSFALATARRTRRIDSDEPLRIASEILIKDQAEDGSWPILDVGPVGSPATYGTPLATASAIRILKMVDATRYAPLIGRAEAKLRATPAKSSLEAAAILLVEPSAGSSAGRQARSFLLKSQNRDGGWGPFADSPVEPFDTAVALIGLAEAPGKPDVAGSIAKGRTALIALQNPDGSWTETTRPAGAESYAQRLSTTGWATSALLTTRPQVQNHR